MVIFDIFCKGLVVFELLKMLVMKKILVLKLTSSLIFFHLPLLDALHQPLSLLPGSSLIPFLDKIVLLLLVAVLLDYYLLLFLLFFSLVE